jgi:hypothetical protein
VNRSVDAAFLILVAATALLVAGNRYQPRGVNGGPRHEQIELTDTLEDAIRKLALGDPIASAILHSFVLYAEGQDPLPYSGFFGILRFDTKNIRGQQIVDLFTRECRNSIECMYDKMMGNRGSREL